jgi:hypothetical protein
MTLLKDLIDIPEHIDKGQFVLRLTEGVTDSQATVAAYVPTPQLVLAFDDALNFIKGSVLGHTSKATYLHGSFGSGKSHFMAILHLILSGNASARAIPELAATIQKHNSWIEGKKFLLVPYHMIASHDVESGILGGYVDFVRRVHPNAPIPGVYLAEGLFKDASALRQRMGDEAFFAAMSEGASADSDFGDVDVGWDAARFNSAVDADPGSEERSQLISALVGKFFGSYDTQAGGHGEAFISLDKGLSVISRHAKDLGYDALILFLDELILWLASHAADLKFVHQEGQKLAKLVEAQTADRPIPVVSFIARQRDLSELIGDSVPGADRLNFGDALKHWEGRFHKITLEDRNLPAIAERRVLKCHTPSARQELNAAFELTAKIRESVMTTLLTGEGDREMFRKVYPFSPALVQTLIAVSSVLQRERTALKVMMQLLVEQRDVLTVGDIVPVGDLFDVIAHGDEAFSQEMAIHFDNAKRLYHQKLLPMLEKTHGRREELEKLPTDDPRRVGFRNDDRLVKTLLLSALVPEVETLRGLNAERLAALNHGTIKTPIAGREGQEVLRRVRNWAASVGEIRIGEETNPSISIQLSGVDTEGIIKQAEREDNQGNRIRRVRQMLFEQLGVSGEDEFQQHYNFTWKNTSRSCTVLFKNIRELPDASFENNDADWKLVIDFPFDEAGYGPKDDISQLQAFKSRNPLGAKTICWIPQFFSTDALKDLGMLVILEHILAGERFGQYSNHLSPQDRQAAKSLLENQRSVLRTRVQNHLDAAYGLDAITQGSLDTTHELEQHEQFVSLDDGFDPQPPVAANLGGAMNHLLSQALMSEFPGAPNFEAEVKIGNLRKVQAVLSEAAQSQDGRVAVEKTIRSLVRHIANPLQLGEMGHDATHFVLGHHWRNHFNKKAAEASSTISVGQLRKWIDQPRAMGLPKEAQNLVILTYAEQTNRTFVFHNAPVDVSLTNLSNDFVLQEQKLPDEAHWNVAVSRAAQIFGEAVSPLMKATTVANLSAALKKKSSEVRSACVTLQERLKDRLLKLGVEPADSSRLTTASATASLVEKLHATEAGQVVSALASAAVATTAAAMGECLSKSSQLLATIESTNWEIFDAIAKLADDRQTVAQSIRSSIAQALQSDEHVTSLGPTLKEAQLKAVRLLTQTPPPPVQVPVPAVTPPVAGVASVTLPGVTTPPVSKPTATKKILESETRSDLTLSELKRIVSDLEQKYTGKQVIKFNASWIVEENGGTE